MQGWAIRRRHKIELEHENVYVMDVVEPTGGAARVQIDAV